MPTYRHPRDVVDGGGLAPAAVDLDGETVRVDRSGATATFSTDNDAAVAALARRYGVAVSDLRVGGDDDSADAGGTDDAVSGCPFCDAYDGDHVAQHASSAHPEEWAAYKAERDAA